MNARDEIAKYLYKQYNKRGMFYQFNQAQGEADQILALVKEKYSDHFVREITELTEENKKLKERLKLMRERMPDRQYIEHQIPFNFPIVTISERERTLIQFTIGFISKQLGLGCE